MSETRYIGIEGHPRYAVSSDGTIRGRRGRHEGARRGLWNEWRELKPWRHKSGHLYIVLDGHQYQVHRLVLTTFDRKPVDGEECRHLDGNPRNNHIDNLAWGTRSENIGDKLRHGTHNRGERHYCAKLSDEQARAAIMLRKRHAKHGGRGSGIVSFISRWFGISQSQASLISRGRAYREAIICGS
jgi:hypothetical protein